MTGKIVRMSDKGFGFIRDLSGKDHFFHRSALMNMEWFELLKNFKPGKFEVEFEERMAEKGPRAENVNIIFEE